MRVACVLIRNAAVQLALSDDLDLRGRPLVIGDLPFEANTVYDASPEAVMDGVRMGMPLLEARGLCPGAVFVVADHRRYELTLERVAGVLEEFGPVVEIEGLGCAYVEITGAADESSLGCRIVERISAETRLRAGVGISGGKFFSRAAACSAAEAPVIVPPGGERRFISPFTIDMLGCSRATRERLGLFGIRTIGELSRLPADALTAQFGAEGRRLHELATGSDRRLLVARRKPEAVSAVVRFDTPAQTYLDMVQECEPVLKALANQSQAMGRFCREMGIRLTFPSVAAETERLTLREATVSAERLLLRLKEWLERANFAEPPDEMELSLLLEREGGQAPTLWRQPGSMKRELGRALSLLRKRFGYQPVKKAIAREPRPMLPEKRFRLIDFDEDT